MNGKNAGIILVAALTFAVYSNSLGNGFVWDDSEIIMKNPRLSGIQNIPVLIFSEDTFPGEKTGYYRPVTYLTFFLDRVIWGLNPFGFHLLNLLLHCTAVITLYVLIKLIFKDHLLALFAALIFSLHPVNTETVNFISGGRNTLLSALFMLVAFICYIRGRPALSVLSFGISIFSKEFGLLLPVLLYSYDRTLLGKKRPYRAYLPYVAMAVIYLVTRSIVVGGSGIDPQTDHLHIRILMAPEIVLRYLKMFILPFWPKIPIVIRPPRSFDLRTMSSIVALIALLSGIFFFRNRSVLFFSLLWILLFLLPVTNILFVGSIQMAERYAYFSSMGFALLLSHILAGTKSRLKYFAVCGVCAIYALVAVNRNPVWKDDYSLYSQMTQDSPDASMGYYNLAMHFSIKGEREKTLYFLEKALRGIPLMPGILTNLAGIYLESGQTGKAVLLLRRALYLDPANLKAMVMISRAYMVMGAAAPSTTYAAKAVELFPDLEQMLKTRAMIACQDAEELEATNTQAAEALYRRALLYDPASARAFLGLGSVIANIGHIEEAIPHFKKAAQLDPLTPVPHYNLAMAYRVKGMKKEAESEMALSEKLSGGRALARYVERPYSRYFLNSRP